MLMKENSVLVVIDIQNILMPKDQEVTAAYVAQCAKLIRVARTLEIPVLVTEQNPNRLGGTCEEILDTLGETPRLPKLEFGCLANAAFRDALEGTGRKQVLIIGMETHVCVMQTALEALRPGLRGLCGAGRRGFVSKKRFQGRHQPDVPGGRGLCQHGDGHF